ncbi:MAG: hypothetical protein JSU90_11725 [Nitrospiraceae bacterium]|nr:MAG: hypothetical protein JSU90_11725 [Nitrospiraceae bacterium]
MGKTNKISCTPAAVLIAAILFSVLFARGTGAAATFDYQVLSSVTSNLSAPTDVALDRVGNVYVAESSANRVQIYNSNGVYLRTLGGLLTPLCVAVDSSDRIYVCNKQNGTVAVYRPDLSLLHRLGWQDGQEVGEFVQPNDIAIDSLGRVFVVDEGGDGVKVYNPDGTLNFEFGGTGRDNGHFNRPSGIAIDDASSEVAVVDHQYTTDSTGGQIEGARIQIFDMNGAFQRGFPKFGNMVGQLFRPQRLAMDGEGRIYVTDSFHNVVIVYDKSDGAHLGDVFDLGDPLRSPIGIVMNSSSRLYVTSLITRKVKVFQILTGGEVVTPGDCNGDGKVDAGDISSLVMEIFDGDGNLPADAPGGTFPGDPVGSDANSDGLVDMQDISCTVHIIFSGPGACN